LSSLGAKAAWQAWASMTLARASTSLPSRWSLRASAKRASARARAGSAGTVAVGGRPWLKAATSRSTAAGLSSPGRKVLMGAAAEFEDVVVRPVQALGAVGGLLGLVEVAGLVEAAALGEHLHRLVLVVLDAGLLDVTDEGFGGVLEVAPLGGGHGAGALAGLG